MSPRDMTDAEITAKFEEFAELFRKLTELLEQMSSNMDLIVSNLGRLAEMQGVKVPPKVERP